MPTITGTLSDIGLASLTSFQPKLVFWPSNGAVSAQGVFFPTKQVEVIPNASGQFSVTLASTTDMLPARTHYRLRAEWLDQQGWSELPLRLYIGTGDASIEDVMEYVPNDLVFVDEAVPIESRPERFQFDPVTGDLFERRG